MSEKFYYPILRKLKIDSWNKVYALYWLIVALLFLLFYMSGILDDIGRLILFVIFFVLYGAFVGVGKIGKSLGYAFFFAFLGALCWFVYTFYI